MTIRVEFETLRGQTITKFYIDQSKTEIHIFTLGDNHYKMYHEQDCCEDVYIEDITGNLSDLIGTPLLMAEEASSSDNPPQYKPDSFTWTFYKFATVKGYVTIRWYGESNGYYSESVDLVKLN